MMINSNLALVLRKSRVTKIILHTPISGKFKVLEKLRNKKSFIKILIGLIIPQLVI